MAALDCFLLLKYVLHALMCNPLMFAAVAILMAAFANRNGIANQGLGQGCLWGRLGWHPLNGTVEDKSGTWRGWLLACVGQFLRAGANQAKGERRAKGQMIRP